jgi:hypothetical protein
MRLESALKQLPRCSGCTPPSHREHVQGETHNAAASNAALSAATAGGCASAEPEERGAGGGGPRLGAAEAAAAWAAPAPAAAALDVGVLEQLTKGMALYGLTVHKAR